MNHLVKITFYFVKGSELEEGDDVEMERDDGNGFQPITGDDSSDEASSRQVRKK